MLQILLSVDALSADDIADVRGTVDYLLVIQVLNMSNLDNPKC